MLKQGLFIALSLLIVSIPGWAQPTYNIDLDTVQAGVQTTKTVNVNDEFLVQVVMTGADRLLGYSFDVDFPEDVLDLVAAYENPGDLNFDSLVGLDEVGASIDFFIENAGRPVPWPLTAEDPADPQQFIYPRDPGTDEGPRNGVLLDANGDNQLGLDEIGRLIDEFILDARPDDAESRALGKTTYWTDLAAARAGENESVEIADPPALSNVGGTPPGRVNDSPAVLLARPDRVVDGTRPGVGLSGDLVLITLRFKAKAAGQATLAFVHEGGEHPVYINEDFQDINTDVIDVLEANTPSSVVTIQ